ncbi:Ig-like domain-containing protein [Aquipuribacter hungaricus]|uniref:Ig-like domain-containing protein n=1 Tax=Aquipuribacter hungaricus TaxID=545624 RepID=A0ABV7WDW8_9MICO
MNRSLRRGHRRWAATTAATLGTVLVATLLGAQPAAADDPDRLNAGIGYPTWAGSTTPVPPLPVPPTVGNQLQSVFDADLAAGAGTDSTKDFWIDQMLARTGTAGGNGDTNNWLFSRGRAAYMYTHQPGVIGFGGSAAYWHELGAGSVYTITAKVGGNDVVMTEVTAERKQTPSYWRSTFVNAAAGLRLVQHKFITHNNVAVTNLELSSTDGAAKGVELRAVSPMATTAEGDELTGTKVTKNSITTLYPRMSGDGFTAAAGALTRQLEVPASGTASTKVQLGYVTTEIPESRTEYDAYRAVTPQAAFTEQVTSYNRWWAENIPFLDTPEDNIDKTLFYRWWLMRFNFLDADVPGNDFQFPTSMEGVTGYNNAIVLTTGMFIDDLKYFRDPVYSYGPWVSAGETARSGKMEDNPGSPANWSNSYTEYVTEAGWRSYQLHGGPAPVAENLAVYGENDVEGLLEAYDGNGNDLIEYDWGAMTGNDADAVSFDWARENGEVNMDRAESAYLYSNAMASAEAYRAAGDEAKAVEMEALAQRVKTAVMGTLWDAEDNLIKHRQAGDSNLLVDWKEINNYYPFTVGLVPKPGDADYDDDYTEALRLWKYADEYPIFPFYTANQADAAERGGEGSNNFSIINSTVTFRMLSSVLRDYPSEHIDASYYKKLLYWNAWSHYIDGDNRMPDQNEFWNSASANTGWGDEQSIGYRSWIHHTILGTTNFTMIEDAMGLRPRSDAKIELDPIDIDWPYFTANNIRYRDKDLTVVWDEPGDGQRPYGTDVPEGYSVFLDGSLAFTVGSLGRVVFDPATGTVTEKDDDVEVLATNASSLQAPEQVRFGDDERVVDLFAKAGADIRTSTTGTANLAEGAAVEATYTAEETYSSAEAAVDGTTINEPFWGTAGSPSATDSITLDLGAAQAFDDVRVYFYRTSSSDSPQGGRLAGTRQGYAAPSMYSVEYLDGSTWTPVPGQAKNPVYPRGNYNQVQLPEVTASKVRITVTHAPGFRTGIKEVQVRRTGAEAPAVTNAAPSVTARPDAAFSQPGAARLVGTVLDDGLPSGQLSSTWTVVEAPEGASALFADARSATTVVRFSTGGRYVLRLTATDGEQSASTDLVVEASGADGAGADVSGAATPTASYTAGWNNVRAVNDGAGANSGGAQDAIWGTWSGSRPASQWLQYTWASPVRVTGSDVMFWSDVAAGTGDGVAVPASWKIQYLDADGAWVDVTGADGYGTERTGTNATTFDAVTTTALRATFSASPNAAGTSFSAVAVAEWEVFADAPVAVDALDVRTTTGQLPALPGTVGVTYADGSRSTAAVVWPEVTPEQVAGDGSFTLTGIVDGSTLPAQVTVWVRSTPPAQVNTVDPVRVGTRTGVAPALPATVTVQYNDGSREMLPVAWEAVDPADYAQVGTFDVGGTVEGPGGQATATATVTVTASGGGGTDPDPDPTEEPGNPILGDGSYYSADPAPLVVTGEDGEEELFVYTGHDEAGPTTNDFIMNEWGAFETDDWRSGEWTHHPSLMRPEEVFSWASPGRAYAGQVVEGVDGRYYWYVPVHEEASTAGDKFGIGVAVSDTPLGPWTDHAGGPLVSQSLPAPNTVHNIDPTVLVTGEGAEAEVHMWWGSFSQLRRVELDQDMKTVTSPAQTVTGLTGFFEGAWAFEREGTYYMAYAANNAGPTSSCTPAVYHACIAYGTAPSPEGPWTYRGVILPPVSSTTSHPGIVEVDGGWVLAYHTADAVGGNHFRRSVAVDELLWDDSVTPAAIRPVVTTPRPVADPTPRANVAHEATVSVSNTPVPTQYWTKALNDELVRPNPLPPDMWGTYDGDHAAQEWVQYTWDTPVRVEGSRIDFWADQPAGSGVGVAPPTSWTVEYWDDEDGWLPVPGASGYPTSTAGPQATTFDAVTTTQLRAVLDASTDGQTYAALAVEEWEVLATQAASLQDLEVTVEVGETDLPRTTTVGFADGTELEALVTWDAVEADQVDEAGATFEVEGTVLGQAGGRVTAVVTVVAAEAPAGDTAAPEVTLTPLGSRGTDGWFRSAVDVLVEAVDDSGLRSTLRTRVDDGTWTATGPARDVEVRVSGEGSHTVAAQAVDRAGNTSGTEQLVVRIDSAAPVVGATVDAAARSITLDATDAGSGVRRVEVRQGEGWVAYTAPLVAPSLDRFDVTYRAVDAAGNVGTAQVATVAADISGPLSGPVAALATPTASYTAPWNNLDAVNDGQVPADPSTGQQWGTWSGDRPASQWLQLTWPRAIRVTDAEIVFDADSPRGTGNGVAPPAGWVLQHLAVDGTWVDVETTSAYGTDPGVAHRITFTPVTTTALRVVLQADSDGTTFSALGVVELGVTADDPGTDPEPPVYGTETSLAEVLGADTSGPEQPKDADGEDFDLVWAAVQRVLAEKPGSPVAVLTDPTAAVTVFLPDDDAFRAGLPALLPGRVANEKAAATRMRSLSVAQLETLLLDHVVVGATVVSADVARMDGQQVTTAAGTVLTVSVGEAGIRLLDADGAVVAVVDADRVDVNLGQVQVAHVIERLITG